MELLHAVLHGALVRSELIVATLQQRGAAGVHSQGYLVVLDAGLHVGGLLGFDELPLECADFLRVEKLHHVECLARSLGKEAGNDQHVRVPLKHHGRVVGQPDGALGGCLALPVVQHHLMPLPVDVRAWPAQCLAARRGNANGLDRILDAHFPAQVFAGDEIAQAWMERTHVVVLQVDLDEGLPVVVALMQVNAIQDISAEIEIGLGAKRRQIGRDIAPSSVENKTVPVLHGVVLQVQAGLVCKVRRCNETAVLFVSPAVQGAGDVQAAGAAAAQHHGLAMPAHIGQQLQAVFSAKQSPSFAFLGQGVIVPHRGNAQLVRDVARRSVKDALALEFELAGIKVA